MEDNAPKRRLATILAADVAGYSKLMAEDEEATVRTLKQHRVVIDKFISRHEGRIFNTGGDSVLAEFGSAVEAVRCAIAIQDELRVRNVELAANRQMLFRIGINVGDVLVDGDNLLGDGINVAARLEGIAAPGGICISGSTFEQVKNKLSIGFEDLGPQQVKNIPEPVTAFGITSSPVSIVKDRDQSTASKSAQSSFKINRKLSLSIVAVILVIVAAAGYWFWQSWGRGPTPLTSFAENVSTDEMRANEIQDLMTGMRIQGVRKVDDQPFTIVLNVDKSASYQFARAGSLSGTFERITGEWRVEDFRFCMKLRRFANGREVCPRIVKSGQTIMATRRDGSQLPWSLSK